MSDFMAFSPCILIILIFLLQNKFFATPEQLEKRLETLENKGIFSGFFKKK